MSELEEMVGSKISALAGRLLRFQTDVSKENQVNTMVAEILQQCGTVDILENVVGMADPIGF